MLHRSPALGGWHLPGGSHGAFVGVRDRRNQLQHALILRDPSRHRQPAWRWQSFKTRMPNRWPVSRKPLAPEAATQRASPFTQRAIEWTAHVLLVLDSGPFALYLVMTSTDLAKEMFK